MDPTVSSLRSQLDPFLRELATLQYHRGAGLPVDESPRAPYARYPALSRAESFHAVRDAAGAGSPDDAEEPRRLRRLLEHLATQLEDVLAAPAAAELAELEARASVQLGEESILFHDALARLPKETSRAKRDALERGLGRFLWEHTSPYARRWEATARIAETLGYPSYQRLLEDVGGYGFAPLVEEGERVLARTEDAWRDLLGYVLKHLEPGLRPLPQGTARYHDLLHAAGAPHLASHFHREELLHAASRCLSGLGLSPDAGRRLRLDAEDRPGKSARPFVAAVQVPDEVRLVVQPEGGLNAYAALLHELGRAQHLAHVSRVAPVEDRRLIDASVSEGYAALFDHLLLDEAWLRRYLRLPQSLSREAARLAAFHQLMLLRRHFAKLAYELSLLARGPGEELSDEYEERQRKALFVGVQRGFFLHDVDPRLYASRRLRGWALEARLVRVLRERFNEDWWRNPAAGAFLAGLFARGGRDDAAALALELSGEPLSWTETSDRLVRVLGA